MTISIHNSQRQVTATNQKPLSLHVFIFILLVACITPIKTVASEATQCANAKNDSDPDTCELWVNGNINHSKAIYFEGGAIPIIFTLIASKYSVPDSKSKIKLFGSVLISVVLPVLGLE